MPLPNKPIRHSPNSNIKGEISQNAAVNPVAPIKQIDKVRMDIYTGQMNWPIPEKNRK
jgi:hypothetical protein